MTNSFIFTQSSKTDPKFYLQSFDCCESLGSWLNDKSAKESLVAIPRKMIDSFFLNEKNLEIFLDFLTKALGIPYRIATEEERARCQLRDINSGIIPAEEDRLSSIVVHCTRERRYSNKRFNCTHNVLRYMWYHEHAQMAIIMTNLHATGVFDPIDTLAIGQSFQTKTGRALLPSATSLIDGLLFFRPMNSGAETELNNGAQFNSVFYKFPMYFNPTLEIRGSFFSEAVVTLRAKDVIGKLIGMEEMQEAPSILMKNLQIIKEDYLAVKELYMVLAKELEANRQQMNFNSPLLLSRNMKDVKVPLYSSMGSATYYFFSNEDGKIVYKTTPGKKEVLEKPKAEMPF